jgi:DnaJ-domain-containing protein 1
MKWFSACSTIDEVRDLYRKLAKEHHPDAGGQTEVMQDINNEYAFASATILKGGNLSESKLEEELRFTEEYAAAIDKIISLPGIIIELIGRWIWVGGATYPVRKQIKAAGFKWAEKKEKWIFRSEDYKSRGRSNKTLDEIRGKYGSQLINQNYRKAIN